MGETSKIQICEKNTDDGFVIEKRITSHQECVQDVEFYEQHVDIGKNNHSQKYIFIILAHPLNPIFSRLDSTIHYGLFVTNKQLGLYYSLFLKF